MAKSEKIALSAKLQTEDEVNLYSSRYQKPAVKSWAGKIKSRDDRFKYSSPLVKRIRQEFEEYKNHGAEEAAISLEIWKLKLMQIRPNTSNIIITADKKLTKVEKILKERLPSKFLLR